MHRIFGIPFSTVYPLYLTKVEKKGRSRDELDQVIRWLTGFSQTDLRKQLANESSLTEFFDAASIHPNAPLITGVICGVRIEELEDPLMKKIRYMDKLVDELAKGRPLEKILRK
ncbi:MAG: DUF2200 domain-containing protein [Micrococcales bacterium]